MTKMMKKLIAAVLAIILIVALIPFSASAAEVRISRDGLLYSLYSRSAAVIGYSDAQGTAMKNIVIPETVTYMGYSFTVEEIASSAFRFTDNSSPLESVTIPKGVTIIESYAFCNCQKLIAVNFADSSKLETLSEGVFKNCYALTSINLPKSLKTIGKSAFDYCCKLSTLTIPDGVTSIGDYAFAGTDVKYFTIPAGVTSFGDMVFDPIFEIGRQVTPYSITFKGTKAQWDELIDGKSLGYDLNAPVYVKADITFENNGRGASIGTKTIDAGTAPGNVLGIGLNGPQLTDDDYVFMGWYKDKNCFFLYDFSEKLRDNVTVYAKWKKVKHTVTYKIVNGKWANGTDRDIKEIVYDANRPSCVPAGMTTERGFDSGKWDVDPSDAIIWGDREFTYTFTPLTEYTVIWLNGDGTELDRKTYYEGEDEPATDKTPVKTEDAQYTYTFERWDYGTVEGTVKTYSPIFTDNEKTLHTVIWLNDDGTEFGIKTYYEGQSEPAIFNSPKKASDLEYNYTFDKWDEGTVDGTTKTYKPIFTQSERPVYTVLVSYGTVDHVQSKAGKLITLTANPADEGMRFTGWKILEGEFTIENNTFIMPESNVELYATYALAKDVDVDFNYPEKAYVGKSFTVSGSVKEDENILDVGGTMNIIFSSSTPEADDAQLYTVPVVNGEFSLTVPSLNTDVHHVWLEYSGYGEYASKLMSNTVKVYEISAASLDLALYEEDIKTVYDFNDELDITNLYIWILWMDGTYEYYPVSADMVSGFDSTKSGVQSLTVACPYPTNEQLSYSVTVKEAPAAPKKDIKECSVTGIKDKTYNGKAQTQKITVKDGNKTLKEGTDYTVSYKDNKKAGKASVIIKGKGSYTDKITKTFKIKKADNKITVKVNAKSVSLKTLKKSKVTVKKSLTVKNAVGKVSYKITSVQKALGKIVKINSKGEITISKWANAKKGNYKINVKITAKGDDNYKSESLNKTVTIKVK